MAFNSAPDRLNGRDRRRIYMQDLVYRDEVDTLAAKQSLPQSGQILTEQLAISAQMMGLTGGSFLITPGEVAEHVKIL